MNTHSAKTAIKKPRPLYLGIDVPLFICIITLLAIGLIFVYSASWEFAVQQDKEPSYFLKRQILFALIGGAGAVFAFFLDYRRLRKLIIPLVIFTLLALFLVGFVLGESRLGARRSLLQGSIQPSELAKLVIIVYLAFWLNDKKNYLNSNDWGVLFLMVVIGAFCSLILIQPDLSATVTVFLIGALMFFLGGAELKQLPKLLAIALVCGSAALIFSSTGQQRLVDYIGGLRDPAQGSYHIIRAIEGIVKGGFFGVGIGKSTVKFTGLPFAPTDSIFAVIVEELGFLGATILILLYIGILWRGITIAKKAPDPVGKLLASGITIWIFLEAMINICVMVNLLPFAGNALPLISYGGSNLATVLTGFGMVMGVSRVTNQQKNELEGRAINAVVDLRRNDGWRGLSGTRRPANYEH
jgi:cell division protein FtsW